VTALSQVIHQYGCIIGWKFPQQDSLAGEKMLHLPEKFLNSLHNQRDLKM
jgi:hypothetical protein